MKKSKIFEKGFCSTLWIFVLMNMIFRDLHELAKSSHIEQILKSNVSGEMFLVYGIILEIPIVMIVLTRVLLPTANKWSNTIAVLIMIVGFSTTLGTADMDDIFFMVMQCIALAVILIIAWTLPKMNKKAGVTLS